MALTWKVPVTAQETALQGQPLSIMEFESPSAAVIAEPVSLGARSAVWWISVMMFIILMMAAFLPTDIVVVASGKIVSTEHTVVMQPVNTSIIKSIDVRVGQIVHRGQVLATLDPTSTDADIAAYKQEVSEYVPQLARLVAEKDSVPYVPRNLADPQQALQFKQWQQDQAYTAATNANYDQQIAGLEQQISGNLAQAAYDKQRLSMANDISALRKQEETMYVGSKLQSLEAADTTVSMEASMQQAIAQAQAEKAQLQATIAQKASADAQMAQTGITTLQTTQTQLDTARQSLQKANANGGLVQMIAPMDGVVLQVEQLSVGSVLTPAEQFIQLVPMDKPLEAEFYIGGQDIGWVQPGDYTEIKFDTFMYSEYGDARGHVTNIGNDSFIAPSSSSSPSQPIIVSTASGDLSQSVLESATMSPTVSVYYIGHAVIDRMALKNVPPDFRMAPGMPISVDIKAGWRTYLNYVFGRVAPTFNEALHEP